MILPFAVVGWTTAGRSTDQFFFALAIATFVANTAALVIESVTISFAQDHAFRGGDILEFATRMWRQTFVAAAAVSAITILFATSLAVPALFSDEARSAVRLSLLLLAPLPPLVAANSILSACLYAQHRYATASLSVACRASGGFIALVATRADHLELVGVGLACGEVIRTLVLRYALTRQQPRTSSEPSDRRDGFSSREVWSLAIPQFASVGLVSLNPLIDRAFASQLRSGSLTTLELAERVFFAGLTFGTAALALVSHVSWSELHVRGLHSQLARDFWSVQRRTALVSGAGAALAILVVAGLRGRFNDWLGLNDSNFSLVSVIYIAAVPVALCQELGVRLVITVRQTPLLPRFAVIAVSANVVFDFIGVRLWGVVGLAAASLGVRLVSMLTYLLVAPTLLTSIKPPERGKSET